MYRVIRPRYLQLAALLAIAAAGFIVSNFYWQTSIQNHTSINMLLLLCGFGGFQLWLALNSGAIEREQENRQDASEGLAPAMSAAQSRFRRAVHRQQENERLHLYQTNADEGFGPETAHPVRAEH